MKNIILKFTVVFGGLLLLAFVDYIVVENIYKGLMLEYNLNWSSFETAPGNRMWWHVAFDILSFGLFLLLFVASGKLTIFLGGMILYHTGVEDLLYFMVQGQKLPLVWEWSNSRPLIGFTRFITDTPDVTLGGILISSTLGIITFLLLCILSEKRKSQTKNMNINK